jgi:hypothetical protein
MGQKLRRILVGGAVAVSAFTGVAVSTVGPAWAYGPKPTPKTNTLTFHTTKPADGGSDGLAAKAAVPAASSGGLAFTGTDVALTSSAGAAAVAAGGIIVLASRKRRQGASHI